MLKNHLVHKFSVKTNNCNKPTLLFITPVSPSSTGGGLQMRAFNVLRSLSRQHKVHLVDADIFCRDSKSDLDAELRGLCKTVFHIQLPFLRKFYARMLRFLRQHSPCLFGRIVKKPMDYICAGLVNRKDLDRVFEERYDKILVFRLYMYPIAELFAKDVQQDTVYLDLDDIESITRSRTANLHRKNGNSCESVLLGAEAAFFESLEEQVIPDCKRVFVASESDRKKMMARTGTQNFRVLPNVYAPRTPLVGAPQDRAFTFLFIGSYGYYPNYDAAVVLCRDVIPRLNELTSVPLSFRFAGGGASKNLQKLIQNTTGAYFMGPVRDIETAYIGVAATLVPLNSGGGTRVKILESFAFGKPVVSTPIGAEGIECEDGVHLLLANTPDMFIEQCLRLSRSPKLCDSLTRAAAELLQRKYHPELLNDQACLIN